MIACPVVSKTAFTLHLASNVHPRLARAWRRL
jgi:hypothetical protein